MQYKNTVETQPASRNPLLWPFASNSIWNTPIGSDAVYVDAGIEPARTLTTDIDHFFALRETDPLQDVYVIGSWRDRTSGTVDRGIDLPIPDELLIPDANEVERPNNSAAFLMPDGETLVQFNALTRDRIGDRIYGIEYPFGNAPDETLDSLGILGGHGGSGLSSIGGTIRLGELTNDEPIRHALKINIWSERYLSYTEGFQGGLGYRWPAVKADRYANSTTYGGQIPALQMGSLLAIPPDVTPESLGITTKPALKMFYALQDYGAYTADDPNRDAHVIAVENGVRQEFEYEFGHDFSDRDSEFFDDVMKLFTVLNVVDNNGPDSIGGGGTPRAPLAPPLDFSYVADLQQLLNDPTVEDAFRADFNGDGNEDLLWRNLATGLNHVWLQDSEGNQIGGGNILPLTDPDWQIQGTPDVDQNGRADIVWENRVTGAQQTWYLDDLRLWVDPETGRRVARWRSSGSGPPRIVFSETPVEGTGLTPQSNNLLTVDSPQPRLKITQLSGAADEVYEIAVVATEADGSINGIASEDTGYIDQVINNARVVFSTLPDSDISNLTPARLLEVTTGSNLQFLIIQNGTIDSLITNGTGDISLALSNSPDQSPFSFISSTNSQAVEVILQPPGIDIPITLQMELTDETPAVGTALQGQPEGEMIDLRAATGELTVKIDVYREAVSDSLLGFYQVENQQGQVFDEFGNLLSPGDIGYVEAAMRHNIAELNMTGENNTVKTNTATIMAGKLLSVFMIVDGSPEQLLDADIANDPRIYFNHLGANDDGIDHVRLLGDNIFGFEDMSGGGDMDYDDAVVRVSFA